MTDDRRISYTAEPTPAARIHPDAKFLWLDPAAHPGADVNPTTVFAPAPEGFSFRAVEFIKTVRRPRSYPGTLTVTAFADPKFRLWVGGAYVGTGPVAAGGDYANTLPMPKQYVNRWDVPVAGNTVELRVLVWTGCGVMTDYSTGKCGFILSAEEGDELLAVTDETWTVRELPGFVSLGAYDFTAPTGEEEAPAVVKGPWNLADPGLPPLQETEILPDTLAREVFAGLVTLRASFERIYSAYLILKIENPLSAPAVVRVGVDELRAPKPDHLRVTVPAGETVVVRSLRMYSVGWMTVSAPVGVEAEAHLSYVRYPVDPANEGWFRCSDEGLNRIYEIGKFTLEMCRQTLHLDSPTHQETLGCTGDYAIEAAMTRMTFGDERLTRLDLLRTADLLLMTDGRMFHTSYSLIWVRMLADYVRRTGDRGCAEACYPAMETLLARFRTYLGERGVIETPPNYMFVDWANIDGFQLHHPPMALGQTVLNAFWSDALRAAEELCRTLGKIREARRLKDERERHRGAFNREFYDFEKNLYRDGWPKDEGDPAPGDWLPENPAKTYYSRHANTLAVLFGMIRGKAARALMERIVTEDALDEGTAIDVQPYFMRYVLLAVWKTGLFSAHGIRLLHLWDRVIEECPKGLAEGWGDFHGDHSHAWGGAPVIEMPLRFTGFRMLRSGWRKFRLDPRLWGTDGFDAAIPTPWGLLRVKAGPYGTTVDVPDAFERVGSELVFRLRDEFLPKKPQKPEEKTEKPVTETEERSGEDALGNGEPG